MNLKFYSISIIVLSLGLVTQLPNLVVAQNVNQVSSDNQTNSVTTSSGSFDASMGFLGTLSIPYTITGGTVKNMEIDVGKIELKITLDTLADGSITVNVPPTSGADGTFVFVDGQKSSFQISDNGNLVEITIPFLKGDSLVEIIGKKDVKSSYNGPPRPISQVSAEGTNTTTQYIVPSNNATKIPLWIKNNAKWWHDGNIGDDDFVKGLQYMIQNGIMKIPPSQANASSSKIIPSWIKNNAGWWASGQLPDDEFVKGVQYLIQQGILKI